MFANADDWVEMALFADYYQDYLRKYIELKNGPPSHDTIHRVMGMISPEILQQLYGKWQERLNQNDGELLKKIICIDGKTMRSNKRKEEKAAHIVSTWSKEDGYCLGQKAVKETSGSLKKALEKENRKIIIHAFVVEPAMNLLKNKPLYVTINQISMQNKDKCSAEKWESGGSCFLSCKKTGSFDLE